VRAFAPLVVLLACALVGGCGGDNDDDAEQIREVVRLSMTTDDPEGDCQERLSDSLIERTYGSRSRCERVQREDDDGADADSVEFATVEVDGNEATAEFEVRGGEVDGAEGALELVREDGDWRIDDVSLGLLRSLVDIGLRSTEGLPSGGLECVRRELEDLPDAEFRDLAYGLIGETQEAGRRTLELLASCEGEGGVSLLRQAFEDGIIESLRESDTSQQEIDCVISSARERLTDEQLVKLLSAPDPDDAAAEALTPVLSDCGQ
jgi:hypothetical protein